MTKAAGGSLYPRLTFNTERMSEKAGRVRARDASYTSERNIYCTEAYKGCEVHLTQLSVNCGKNFAPLVRLTFLSLFPAVNLHTVLETVNTGQTSHAAIDERGQISLV